MDSIVYETKAVITQHNNIPSQATVTLNNGVVSEALVKLMLHSSMYVPGCPRGQCCIFLGRRSDVFKTPRTTSAFMLEGLRL